MAAQTYLLTLIRMFAEKFETEEFSITIHKHGDVITTSTDVSAAMSVFAMTSSIMESIANLMTDPKIRNVLGDLDEEAQDYAGLMYTGIMNLVKEKCYEIADSED